MDIKTKGFSMPDGNTHIFIPPAPTETDRGGITAKPRTTEAAEVVVDSGTGKGYIGTDHTLKAKGQAADSEAVGISISEKADRIISSASGENVILTDSAEAPLQGFKVFGKSTQNGEPTPENPVPIVSVGDKGNIEVDVVGRNLIPNNYKSTTHNGITYTVLDDGRVLANGTAIGNADGYSRFVLMIKPDFNQKKIYLSGGKSRSILISYTNMIDNSYASCGSGVLIPNEFDYSKYPDACIQIQITNGTTVNNALIEPMLNSGDSALPFEPYREPQSLTLSTPNGLPGIKVDSGGNYTDSNGQQWICDERDYERGKYVQRIYKNIFNGNEEWSIHNGALVGNRYSLHFPVLVKASHLGNIFSMNTNLAIGKLGGTWDTANVYTITNNDSGSDILCSLNGDETLDNFKAFLSQKPMTVITVLQTPIERDLAPEEIAAYKALHTNYPTTVIGNDENAGMEATYVADTKNYIDKKFEKLNQAIVNTQIALL